MKKLKLLLLSIFTVILFAGCSAIGTTIGALGSVIFESPDLDLQKKQRLEKLMNYPKKVLLTESETIKAYQNICALTHLKKYKNGKGNYKEKALEFCKNKQNSQIYFLKEIDMGVGLQTAIHPQVIDNKRVITTRREYSSEAELPETIYLQVIDNKPVRYISIEREYSNELGRTIPIVERLH